MKNDNNEFRLDERENKSVIFGSFLHRAFIRKVGFLDIPGRTRMAIELPHAIIF